MNLVKISVFSAFLLAFALQISAQQKTSKIDWKNLQAKYESFYDVKPEIVNENEKPIFIYSAFYQAKLNYFNESKNQWESVYPAVCGNTVISSSRLKLMPKSSSNLNLDIDFWWSYTEPGFGKIDPLENLRESGMGKFRFEINYGYKRNQITETTFSPDFLVKITKKN